MIEIAHPRGRNLNEGRASNSDPEGEIYLFYMDRLMMDCFSHLFKVFYRDIR